MNPAIRRVAVALLLLFVALLVNANVLQVVDAGSLRNNGHNSRVILRAYAHERGPIVVAGRAIAESVKTSDTLKYLRVYPGGPPYAPITGYFSIVYGATGIERAENDVLTGDDPRFFVRRLSDLITGRQVQGGAVVLTINPRAQQAAWQALQGKQGAVVALDPRTGAILALVTSPSFDPSTLTRHSSASDETAFRQLLSQSGDPLLDRALQQTYPPGSMFKIITASAALAGGRYTPNSQVPAPSKLKLPLTNIFLHNFGGETCGNGQSDTISDAFRISCNTAFANLGISLGANALRSQAAAFGFGAGFGVPLAVAPSVFPASPDTPQTALSAIGQFDVRVTPLQAAMLAAAIANNGVLMRPYLIAKIQAPDLSTIMTAQPHELDRAVSASVAAQMKALMELVVASGTGTAAQIPGVVVAGKTGTAQHGGAAPHAWFTAFAPADNPQVAVAVIVENGGGLGSDATGGKVAAPIARAVIQAVLGR